MGASATTSQGHRGHIGAPFLQIGGDATCIARAHRRGPSGAIPLPHRRNLRNRHDRLSERHNPQNIGRGTKRAPTSENVMPDPKIADHGGDVKMCCKTQHPRRVQRSVGNRRSRHPSEKPTKTRTNSHLRVRRLRCGVVAHSESPTKNRSERLRSGVGDICGVVTTGCPKHTTHKT